MGKGVGVLRACVCACVLCSNVCRAWRVVESEIWRSLLCGCETVPERGTRHGPCTCPSFFTETNAVWSGGAAPLQCLGKPDVPFSSELEGTFQTIARNLDCVRSSHLPFFQNTRLSPDCDQSFSRRHTLHNAPAPPPPCAFPSFVFPAVSGGDKQEGGAHQSCGNRILRAPTLPPIAWRYSQPTPYYFLDIPHLSPWRPLRPRRALRSKPFWQRC
jgi:hypothetical protein